MATIFTDDYDGRPYTWSDETGPWCVFKTDRIVQAPIKLDGHPMPEYVWQQAKAGDIVTVDETGQR